MISEKLDSVEENRGKKIYAVALTMESRQGYEL